MKIWKILIVVIAMFMNSELLAKESMPSLNLSTNVTNSFQDTHLTCYSLVHRTWSYPDATITPFCNDAETSCLRYGLIVRAIAIKKKGGKLPIKVSHLERNLSFALEDVKIKLRGCQLALDYISGGPLSKGVSSLQEAAGYKGDPILN